MPYRTLPTQPSIKRKECLLFHLWYPLLKLEKELEIQRKVTGKEEDYRFAALIDVNEDYILVCEDCGKEKELDNNPVYIAMMAEDIIERRKSLWKTKI